MKRKAADEGGLAVRSKRPQVDVEAAAPEEQDQETAKSASIYDDDSSDASNATPKDTQTPAATTIGSTAASASSRRNRRFPSDLKTIQCTHPGCTKTFNRPARLTAHLRSHSNDRQFRCPYPDCGKDYLEEKHLAQHIKGSHTHEKDHVCPECGKAFMTGTRLRRHGEVHKGAEKYRCRGYDCSLSFRKHQTLQRHIREAHLGLKPFVCTTDGCTSEGFDSAGALRRHVQRDHGTIRFWCDECQDEEGNKAGFTTLLMLQTHARDHVRCAFCPERGVFRGQAAYHHHMDIHHSGITVEERKTVACKWDGCDKMFTRVSNMMVHYRTSHEGRRFVCGQFDTYTTKDISDWNWQEEGCGDQFISRLKLEEHVRYVHLGRKRPERSYPVPSRTSGLEVDAMTAGSGAMECPVGCQAKFKRHADLRRHMRDEHPDQFVHPSLPNLVGEEQVFYEEQPVEDQLMAALQYPDLQEPGEAFDYPEEVLLSNENDHLPSWMNAQPEMDHQVLYPELEVNNQ
ncbi:putative zinc finger protein 467 protein [Cladorrhinum sp. PSN259]|nr:putative zinc finger protein 467 protein [Cladorrhinum sp. PSN259]